MFQLRPPLRVGFAVLLSLLLIIAATGLTSAAATDPSNATRTVTLADNGQTIVLNVGERFLLKLGSDYNWQVSIADQTIVSRVPNILVIRGAQGIYEAHQSGMTTLNAAGDPTCRTATPPCELPSRAFQLRLVVEPAGIDTANGDIFDLLGARVGW